MSLSACACAAAFLLPSTCVLFLLRSLLRCGGIDGWCVDKQSLFVDDPKSAACWCFCETYLLLACGNAAKFQNKIVPRVTVSRRI